MSNSKRWELAISAKSKDGKWRSTRVGVVFEGDKGQLQIRIDPGVSVSTPEGVLLTGWLPSEDGGGRGKGGGGQRGDSGPRGGGGYEGGSTGDDSDPIPF